MKLGGMLWLTAVLALAASCSEDPSDQPRIKGSCTSKWDDMGSRPDGPLYCRDDRSASGCDDEGAQFSDIDDCEDLGFNFCCVTVNSSYRFKDEADALWFDMLTDRTGSLDDCAPNPVTCEN